MSSTSINVNSLDFAIGSFFGINLVVVLIIWILLIIALWKMFKKAGEGGWKSLIPIYNFYILFKIAWSRKAFWIALLFSIILVIIQAFFGQGTTAYQYMGNIISLFCFIIDIILSYKISEAYGHGFGYTLGLIFLPNIFTLILGFGKSKYVGKRRN